MLRAFLVPFYLLKSTITILTTPRILTMCVFPILFGIGTFLAAVVVSIIFRANIADILYHFDSAWLQAGLEWLLILFIVLISAFISYFVTSLVGSFSYESVTLEVMKIHELPQGIDESTLTSALLRGTVHEIYKVVFIGTLSAATFLPILAPVALPLSFYLIAFEYFDLPMQLQGHSFSYRAKVISKHLPEVLVLGAITTALFLIPLGALLFTPVLHATAIRVMAAWEQRLPEGQNQALQA